MKADEPKAPAHDIASLSGPTIEHFVECRDRAFWGGSNTTDVTVRCL